MITWKKAVSAAVGLVAIVAAADVAIEKASSVQTDEEAQIWRSDHILTEAEKFKADRVDRVQRESDRVEYDLLDSTLLPEQKAFMERQLIKNDKKIECIRDDKC